MRDLSRIAAEPQNLSNHQCQNDDCAGLMQQRDRDRHLVQQRHDAKERLKQHGDRDQDRAVDGPAINPRPDCIDHVNDRHREQQIGDHAMHELHG